MQGRLSPPVGDAFQSFPAATWEREFDLAREAQLDCIEWIYDAGSRSDNPILSDAGRAAIRAASERSGVQVSSVCADIFMVDHILDQDGAPGEEAVARLQSLLKQAGELGCRYVLLPFVDSSSLPRGHWKGGLTGLLRRVLTNHQGAGVELHLETDLEPPELADFLAGLGDPRVKANVDTGNSASLGFEPDSEMDGLTPFLGSVHVKDRVRGGGTVPLGEGDADLPRYFDRFTRAGFGGPYIMQVARGNPGEELAWVSRNRVRIQALLAERGNSGQ